MRAAIRTILMQPTLLQRIKRLFANGTQGLWLDCSDMATMYQDSAGTTPVTALEQPVGLIRDKSGRGNHASQATAAKRPVLSARVNQLLATDGDVTTYSTRSNVIAAVTTIPGFTNSVHFNDGVLDAYAYKTFTHTVGVPYVLSVYVQMDDGLAPVVGGNDAASDFGMVVFGGLDTSGMVSESLGSGLYRISIPEIGVGAMGNFGIVKYAANTARTFKVAGYQLETGSVATRYQKINTATDYDSAGFKTYLKFDGVDDALSTASIDFTATDKMTVVAGVRKLSDAAAGVVAEFSATSSGNSRTFAMLAPSGALANFFWRSYGTASADAITSSSFASPKSAVLAGVGSISTDTTTLSVNGTQAATSATDQGTGNYGNHPLYIGARAGTSLYFNGHIYGLIIRGAKSSASQISDAERWVNGKTGAY